MKFLSSQYYIIILLCMSGFIFAQKQKFSDYYAIQKQYENRAENDSTALPLVAKYISKAKKEKNYRKLVLGYKDALVFSPDGNDKLRYADSVVCAAIMTKDKELISNAYLNKGVVYYFNLKKYRLALTEYLKAYEYCGQNCDPYHKNRLRYLIGVVKSYCGYYDDALNEFRQTKTFFEIENKKDLHPNLQYGNRRGYFNSLHQMAVCYRNLGNFKISDSLLYIGLAGTMSDHELQQEHGYFLKERGLSEYNREEYEKSISTLLESLKEISDVKDFAWATVCYSYIGRSYQQLGHMDAAISYFEKVDSVFNRHNFILPEVLNNYGILISYYKKRRDVEKQLYFTTRLQKADSLIRRDFTYLSSKMHREYDTRTLEEEKLKLEKQSSIGKWIIMILSFVALSLMVILTIRARSEKRIRENYKILEQKILARENVPVVRTDPEKQTEKNDIEQALVDDILGKLEHFEASHAYLEAGLTINKLAAKFDTNRNYLSQIVHDHRGLSFSRYLTELRISYITNKLYNEKKYLNYKIETLAEECGIASRTNFSNLFFEINGIRPGDFIKKRLKDLESNNP